MVVLDYVRKGQSRQFMILAANTPAKREVVCAILISECNAVRLPDDGKIVRLAAGECDPPREFSF